MQNGQIRSAPLLAGWVIAGAAGAVAAAVAVVVGQMELTPAVFIGALVAGPVGVLLGFDWSQQAPLVSVVPVQQAVTEAAPDASPNIGRPVGLLAARDGRADDLKIIKGIGPRLEELCHSLGFYHFDQVAGWTGAEVAWVDDNLEGFKGRVTRDRWVEQAKAIVAHGPEEFLRRLDAGEKV